MTRVLQALVAFSSCWILASSLWFYPHSLSYFNELVGGPENGPQHLLGSNFDWGQDLRYAIWWLESNSKLRSGPVCLAYAGSFNPTFVGLDWTVPISKRELDSIVGETPQGFARVGGTNAIILRGPTMISLNLLFGSTLPVFDGAAGKWRSIDYDNSDVVGEAFRSVTRVCYTMFLLH
jgi:hypothetical protein